MKKISVIYCDFDGTITKKDAVNGFFEKYADAKWLQYEDLWMEGKISSRENAIKQVALIENVSQNQINQYIDSIEIDKSFLDFVAYLQKKEIKLTVLSDGFDLFIKKTLEKYNLDIPIYANHLFFKDNKLQIEFPYYNEKCDISAGMCKCNKIKEKEFCYIGDGTSDLCVAKKASVLFATKKLRQYCEKNNISHYPFDSFMDIIEI